MTVPPPIAGLLETALYVDDLARSAAFFETIVGLKAMFRSERLIAYDAGPHAVLLVFARGGSTEDSVSERGTIPGHDGKGPLHMAFRIAAGNYEAWRTHLTAAGVPIRGEMAWPAGGHSLYFEDPDGHMLELATPGIWPNDPVA
ncbi:VOC family protein [Hephaestia sp. GCM10023244]|uniref:VOC family protein n=1 Tax=unclassified Hephaestia TaxID=2631281 RepID=UPI0020771A0B|nr:VOC family protein [Hephaestia sp. MAHUQ-44]MCM8729714.1 VOC family protein [Hephaestia sp. MAHUQ-44]